MNPSPPLKASFRETFYPWNTLFLEASFHLTSTSPCPAKSSLRENSPAPWDIPPKAQNQQQKPHSLKINLPPPLSPKQEILTTAYYPSLPLLKSKGAEGANGIWNCCTEGNHIWEQIIEKDNPTSCTFSTVGLILTHLKNFLLTSCFVLTPISNFNNLVTPLFVSIYTKIC